MYNWVYLFLFIVWVLTGAGDIFFAITYFKDKKYFQFGFWTMMALTAIVSLVDLIIGG